MDIAITIVYCSIIWLIFVKLKLLPFTLTAKITSALILILFYFTQFLLLGQYTPHSNQTFVQQHVLQIAPEFGGYVQKVYVDDWQQVEKGDPIFSISNENLRLRKEKLEAKIDTLNDKIVDAKKLVPVGAMGKRELDEIKNDKIAMEKEIELISQNIQDTVVRAPHSGVVANLNLRPGIFIRIKQPVATIISDEKKWVVAFVNQFGIRNIKPGDNVDMIFNMYPGDSFPGKVESILWGGRRSQIVPNGFLPSDKEYSGEDTFLVKIALDQETQDKLKFSAKGRAVIFTSKSFDMLEIFRRVESRLRSLLGYFWILSDH